jgi:fatty acid desaturase
VWYVAGIHYAVSPSPVWNKLIGYYSMSGLANPAMWEQQHNYGHHTFTNEHENVSPSSGCILASVCDFCVCP